MHKKAEKSRKKKKIVENISQQQLSFITKMISINNNIINIILISTIRIIYIPISTIWTKNVKILFLRRFLDL